MEFYYYIIVFLIGLSVGSFFNVVIFRFDLKRSVIKGRSQCASCRSWIRWFDLIPVMSFLFLKGRCRECKEKISFMYPTVEMSTAVMLSLLFLNTPTLSYSALLNAFIISLFTLILFLDIRYLIISDKILILLTTAAVGLKLLSGHVNFFQLLVFALGLASFFAILFLASRGRWIGFGDVKLIFIIGFTLEYPAGYLAVVLAVWLAAVFSIILLALKKADTKTKIPFGAFLSATAIIFIIFNHELQEISKYFS